MPTFNGTVEQIENNVNKVAEITKENTNETNYPSTVAVAKYVEENSGGVADLTYNPESENAQSGKAVAEATNAKMDKFGEVTTDGGTMIIDVTNNNAISDTYFKQTKDNYIRLNSGYMDIESMMLTFKSNPLFEKGASLGECNIDDTTSAVNMLTLNQLLAEKEDIWNRKDSIAEDIAINEPNAYPTVAAVYNFVNEKIGDIEATLDELHNYAEALKGGIVTYSNITLADSETGANYTLSVANGKVVLNEEAE